MKNLQTILLSFLFINTLNAATHIVTTGEDSIEGRDDSNPGALRVIVYNAAPGDTIIFAPDVKQVDLKYRRITINKDLTICGGNDLENKVILNNTNDTV